MNMSTPETASLLSLMNNVEELDWYFQDMFDQLGNLYCFFNNINHLLVDCPLEFLLFEIQQLVSFLQWWHWHAPYSSLWTKVLCSLTHLLLFRNLCPPHSGGPPNFSCSISFTGSTHFSSSFSTLFNHLFHYFFPWTNSSGIMGQLRLCFCGICHRQYHLPTFVQSCRHMHTPISIATTTDTNSTQSRSTSWQGRGCTPPQIPLTRRILHTHHDNTPLSITAPVVVRIPTPIPPTSITHYVSPLITQFNPCISCSSADSHLPDCMA